MSNNDESTEPLTSTSFMMMWHKDILPSIKNEIRIELKVEIDALKDTIKKLIDRCNQLESSQSFISQKFDDLTRSLQETKKQVCTLESKVNEQGRSIAFLRDEGSVRDCEIDEVQQYSRRDCLEIVGIPSLPNDNPKKLFMDLCSQMDIDLDEKEIAIVHRLPDTKGQKNRMIAKLVRREVKERIYRHKKKLVGKTTKIIPAVNSELGKSIPPNPNKIFINESLTSYRKKIFNKAYKFKKDNQFKFLWTMNGKIFLRENESGPVHSFSTLNEFCGFEQAYYS